MKIAVMAAGGLGGYYGALLARDGHDVMFIARGAHLDAIRKNGLTIRSVNGDFVIKPAKATDNPAEIGVVDWVLFAVKTYDTETAAQAIRPMVGTNTTVVTLQNGVEAPDQIGAVIGREQVLVGPTEIFSNIIAPGVIEQKSTFRNTTVGEVGDDASGQGLTPRAQEIVDALKRTGINATAVSDGLKPLWQKFILLASHSGLTTLARTEAYVLYQRPEARALLRAAMEEVYTVGQAHGIVMDTDIVERHYNFALTFKPGQKTSMHVDLERGSRLEIDALNGAVVRLGAAKGRKTPVHQTICVALKMEDERAKIRKEK